MAASDAILAENANPNTTPLAPRTKPPRGKKRVSISPNKPTVSHFAKDEEEDITWGLDDSSDEETNVSAKKSTKPRRRRRSSARFLRLSAGSAAGAAEGDAEAPEGEFTSSEHLGEIYRQAIRMNAENKINAGNSWGLKLIENMDKFIEEDESSGAPTPRQNERKVKPRDEKGRVNFTKASCTLDASVKIYSYRVDDVHLSSYRVLANLNRTDNKEPVDEEGGEVVEEGTGKPVRRRNVERKGGVETIESNLANINMSKLDSAYDIDPLFHKMSKAFDEGGAKGLLLGNLGVSTKGCHIVFESKKELDDSEDSPNRDNACGDEEAEEVPVAEAEIDISPLATKLDNMLLAYGVQSSDSVHFVPQLRSLRDDYAALEEEGFGVDEKDAARDGRRRLKLYDAPEDEEKEAEKSIHYIAMERSRGSVLGMSFDTNFRLSVGSAGEGEGEFMPMAEEEGSFGGDGEFAPVDFGGGEDEFASDFGYDAAGNASEAFTNRTSYNNTKVLLDALCDGDAFYDDRVDSNSDYAFFDMKRFEKATDGNLWAGSQHWKKAPGITKSQNNGSEKRKVKFGDEDDAESKKKRSTKKDRIFIDFSLPPNIDSIFEQKKTKGTRKKTSADPFQMSKTEKDFLLPADANVGASALKRLFSRPNAVVQKFSGTPSKSTGKTVGFLDVDDNALGFDCDNDYDGSDSGGFNVEFGVDEGAAYDDADYHTDNFDEVRKVQKIDINYATVDKKVDVRRLKRDLWVELEQKTATVPPEDFSANDASDMSVTQDDIDDDNSKPRLVSFKETVENMERAQSQHDVTVSFYFICCLHLANEKGLKLDSTGLEDFMISMDDGSSNFKELLDDMRENAEA